MLIIGENLNVISKKIGAALKDRDPEPIREMAEAQTKAGVDLIDINLGPARKAGRGAYGVGGQDGAGSDRYHPSPSTRAMWKPWRRG